MIDTINALCVFLENLLNNVGEHSTGVWSFILKWIVATVIACAILGIVYILSPVYDSLVGANFSGNTSSWICIILGFLILYAVILAWSFIDDFIRSRANAFRKKVEEEYIEEQKRQRRHRRFVKEQEKRRLRIEEERKQVLSSVSKTLQMCKTF